MKCIAFSPFLAMSSSYLESRLLISVSSTVVFLLTVIIGNFGVSDADVVLTSRNDPTTNPYPNADHTDVLGDPNTSTSSSSTIRIATKGTPENLRFVHGDSSSVSEIPPGVKRAEDIYKHEPPVDTLSTSFPEPPAVGVGATYTPPLIPIPLPLQRPYIPQIDGYHKRRKRVAADNPASLPNGEDNDPPIPLLMGDYGDLDRGRLLDQLVIRALANPEAWAELRQSFDTVDEKLHLLHALESQRNPAVSEDNRAEEMWKRFVYDKNGTFARNSSLVMSKSLVAEKRVEYRDSPKWKFTYHRVHDLNAAGHPTLRAIAAVVSQERAIDSESGGGVNKTGQNNSFGLKGTFRDKVPFDRGNTTSQGSDNATRPLTYTSRASTRDGDFKGKSVSQKERNQTANESESDAGVYNRKERTNDTARLALTESAMPKEQQAAQWEVRPWERKEKNVLDARSMWSIPGNQEQRRQKGDGEVQQQLDSLRAHRHHHGNSKRQYHRRRQHSWRELTK